VCQPAATGLQWPPQVAVFTVMTFARLVLPPPQPATSPAASAPALSQAAALAVRRSLGRLAEMSFIS
jgi:hypothetical protein